MGHLLRDHAEIESFYREQYKRYGATPRGAAWADTTEQYNRVRQARRLVNLLRHGGIPSRVLEIGCGYGLLPQTWQYDGDMIVEYTGVDLLKEYIEHAQLIFYKEPGYVFSCEPFEEFVVLEPYELTLAIGVVTWQPKVAATTILMKLWDATADGGFMLFTYLPGEPIVAAEVNILRNAFGVKQWAEYSGYAKSGERMVIFEKKGESNNFEADNLEARVLADPNTVEQIQAGLASGKRVNRPRAEEEDDLNGSE